MDLLYTYSFVWDILLQPIAILFYIKNVRMLLESFVHFVMAVDAVIQTYSREVAPFN